MEFAPRSRATDLFEYRLRQLRINFRCQTTMSTTEFPGETLGTVSHKNAERSPKRSTRQRPRMPECYQARSAESIHSRPSGIDRYIATKIAVGAKLAIGWTADDPSMSGTRWCQSSQS